MGLAGRKRRLRNFDERAKQFASALAKKEGSASKGANRDFRPITVGTGQHRRLVIKGKPQHAYVADHITKMLLADLQAKKVTPKTFVLVQPRLSENGVQEYFHKPSINSLGEYLSPRYREVLKGRRPDDYALSRQFANQRQNKGITYSQLVEAFDEFNGHLDAMKDGLGRVLSTNLIVLGKTKEGKLRLALIDV